MNSDIPIQQAVEEENTTKTTKNTGSNMTTQAFLQQGIVPLLRQDGLKQMRLQLFYHSNQMVRRKQELWL